MGLLLAAGLAALVAWSTMGSMTALVAGIALGLWLVVHLVIRSSRDREKRG